MMINTLIGWNILLTIAVIALAVINKNEPRLNRIEMDIAKNETFDVIEEDIDITYPYGHGWCGEGKQRIVSIKEAIGCLYKYHNLHLRYKPEKTKITNEEVSAV